MYIKKFIIILLILVILKSLISYEYENFNIFSDMINNPGGAVAGQASSIWNANLMFLQSFSLIIGAAIAALTYYLLARE